MTPTSQDFITLERDSWIDQATAERFGLYRVDSLEGAERVGRTDRENYAGIVFPIYWPGDSKAREYHLRRDHPPMENGKPKQKYLAPPGRGNMLLFGPGELVETLTDTTRPILLVEGLKKLLAAYRLARHDAEAPRFLACAISGVWNWKGRKGKTTDATGARVDDKGPIPDLDRVAWTGRNVVIIFDSDCADNDSVTAARRGLMAELRKRGARVVALDLPALGGLNKTGFDDLLAQRGPEHALGWIVGAIPPDGSQLLDDLHAFLGRFVSYPNEYAHVAHTLWVAHTHFMEKWESTPRLAFLSPEWGSGKTRALEVTEPLVPRPVEAVNATSAYIFRKISAPDGLPTILFDEIDTIFGPKAREHEDLRGVLNAGHRRGAVAGRCVIRGKSVETEELPAYCAVALAGLGNLPDTILSRSVVIRMRRRAPGEKVEPWRRKIHAHEGHILRDRLVAWANAIASYVPENPMMPDGVSDRPADVWEPLLAVAEAAGETWPERARVSCVSHVSLSMGNQDSFGVTLLSDLQTIFADHEAMFTDDILPALHNLDESPWGDFHGKPLNARKLARFLKEYGIESKQVRCGASTAKGYRREYFHDAWTRYLTPLPPSPIRSETKETSETAHSQSDEKCFGTTTLTGLTSDTVEAEEVSLW